MIFIAQDRKFDRVARPFIFHEVDEHIAKDTHRPAIDGDDQVTAGRQLRNAALATPAFQPSLIGWTAGNDIQNVGAAGLG